MPIQSPPAPSSLRFLATSALAFHAAPLHAGSIYWDANAATTGAGAGVTGNWGTDNFWNTDSAGDAGTFSTSIATTDTAVFFAGTDAATGTFTLNSASGTVNASTIHFATNIGTATGGTG